MLEYTMLSGLHFIDCDIATIRWQKYMGVYKNDQFTFSQYIPENSETEVD